jgi:hypothetical protein
MTDRDTFASLRRAQEDKYFLNREHELMEKLHRRFELETQLRQMAAEAHFANEALLRDLEQLGYTPATIPLLYLAPIVYVAWAEGFVTEGERERVLEVARERGIAADSPAFAQLVNWLDHRPSDELLEKSIGIVQAVMHAHPAVEEAAEKFEMIADINRVVDSSGDILLLWHQMTPNERAAVNHIVEELNREHYAGQDAVAE